MSPESSHKAVKQAYAANWEESVRAYDSGRLADLRRCHKREVKLRKKDEILLKKRGLFISYTQEEKIAIWREYKRKGRIRC